MTWPQYKRRECTVSRVVKLSPLQHEVLTMLVMRHGMVTYNELITAVYGAGREPEWAHTTIAGAVAQLRKRLGDVIYTNHTRGLIIDENERMAA